MPSSFQIRAAVFGPRPGSRMNWTTSAGTVALRFASASISPCSTIWTIFSSIVLPIPCSSFALPVEGELGDRAGRLPHPRRGAPVGEHAERLGALELQQVGEQVELRPRRSALRRQAATPPIIRRPRRRSSHYLVRSCRDVDVCLPTYNERENLEPMLQRARAARRTACS